MKTSLTVVCFLIAAVSMGKMLTVRLLQESGETKCAINDKAVNKEELERLLKRLSSIDGNQHLFIITSSNVPAAELVGTIGIVQRSGLHNIAIICEGSDGTYSGIWRITVDAIKTAIPSCIDGYESESGFISSDEDWKTIPRQIGSQQGRSD